MNGSRVYHNLKFVLLISYSISRYREVLQREAEGSKQQVEEQKLRWSQEQHQLREENNSLTEQIRILQAGLTSAQQETAQVICDSVAAGQLSKHTWYLR